MAWSRHDPVDRAAIAVHAVVQASAVTVALMRHERRHEDLAYPLGRGVGGPKQTQIVYRIGMAEKAVAKAITPSRWSAT